MQFLTPLADTRSSLSAGNVTLSTVMPTSESGFSSRGSGAQVVVVKMALGLACTALVTFSQSRPSPTVADTRDWTFTDGIPHVTRAITGARLLPPTTGARRTENQSKAVATPTSS